MISIALFQSSRMPYEDQTLIPILQRLLPNQPLSGFFNRIQFSYGNEVISMESMGYYSLLEIFIRKGAHFINFGFLGLSIYFFLKPYINHAIILYGVAITLTFGLVSFDELHQVSTPNRSGCIEDVLLDTLGAIVFVSLAHFFISLFRQNKQTDSDNKSFCFFC